MMRAGTVMAVLLMLTSLVRADVRIEKVDYKDGDIVLHGYVAYDDTVKGRRPGVLVCHQWMGITDHEKQTAAKLAKLGYVAFLVDVYGEADRPTKRSEAGRSAGKYKNDRALLRRRVNRALAVLRDETLVDGRRVAAIGYCFGGTAALELARSGADVRGVVSFHGGLGSPKPEDAKQIKGRVLVLHGADDPFVPADEVAGFKKEMRDAAVDWQFISYGDAVHSFTQKSAGRDKSRGAAYNEKAAKRSWQHMKLFFEEIFANDRGGDS